MKTRKIALALTTLLASVAVSFAAEDAYIGTWKLNEAKSKLDPRQAKTITVVYAAVGDHVKATTDGLDPNGKPIHTEWTGKFDGKDYPVTGDPNHQDMRAYRRVNGHTLTETVKKGGKVIATVRTVISADGRTRTSTVTSTDANGHKVTSVRVYDKQ